MCRHRYDKAGIYWFTSGVVRGNPKLAFAGQVVVRARNATEYDGELVVKIKSKHFNIEKVKASF